jgi:hypothetical protein
MALHPARAVASILLIGGSLLVSVTALAIMVANALVGAGMAVSASDALLLGDLVAVLPFVIAFAVTGFVAAVGLFVGKGWADDLAFGTAIVAIAVGAIGLILLVIGRDPAASAQAARSTDETIAVISVFTAFYLSIIVAVAVARLPRPIPTGATA